jgi:hypothetical protein
MLEEGVVGEFGWREVVGSVAAVHRWVIQGGFVSSALCQFDATAFTPPVLPRLLIFRTGLVYVVSELMFIEKLRD